MTKQGELTSAASNSADETRASVPSILFNKNNQEEIEAIEYTKNGVYYYFSNKQGHKVYSYDRHLCRPMTKKEFKMICTEMLDNLDKYGDKQFIILAEIENLDFGLGHANSTFEIIRSWSTTSKLGTLAINIGTGRFLYNVDANTVFHIDHSKFINGTMLKSPEKDEIIKKITASRTMSKKINQILQS